MSRLDTGPTVALLVLALSGCSGSIADSGSAPQRAAIDVAHEPSQGDAQQATVVSPEPATEPEPAPDKPLELDDLLGDDGRLSVLILGTDRRQGIIGERTDAIIVATISPETGRIAMVSMPRDTVNVPIGPGRVHTGRINTLYQDYKRNSKKQRVALKKTRKAFEFAFDTEIDYYALVDFRGLIRLIDTIGGVDVTLDEKLVDPTMHLTPKGLRLKKGDRHLDGETTLAFTRTRYADSDYERSRRQQQVLTAAAERVSQNGLAAMPDLIEMAGKRMVTDFPLRAAPLLLELAGDARLDKPKSVVLSPGRFARQGPQIFTIAPKVAAVRKMFSKAFGPLD